MTFNSHKDGQVWIGELPQINDLDRAGFEAVNWILIGGVGALPDIGVTESITSFNALEGATCKTKGNRDAGDPEITYKRNETDAGQIKMLEAGLTSVAWPIRIVYGDATPTMTSTIAYTRGVVTRPRIVGGDGDAPDLRASTFGLTQEPLEVHPEVI